MAQTITATFATRRDTDMAVEHLIQEHGVNPDAITVFAGSERNSAGIQAAGGDLKSGQRKRDSAGEPKLAGRVVVSAQVEDELAEKVRSSFLTFGGKAKE